MLPRLTSIIIPTYNHAEHLPAAIDSALAQTSPVEVIVVDDGSTDDTMEVGLSYTASAKMDPRVRYFPTLHHGPSAARNHGLTHCAGEFVMFLDADDIIYRDKVKRQIDVMDRGFDWVLCDVDIENVGGSVQKASDRYHYGEGDSTPGEFLAKLNAANFIPIMAPLLRREAIGSLRFPDGALEDWAFWRMFAPGRHPGFADGPPLARYIKRRSGRNTQANKEPAPLLLNLGCGTMNSPSWHPQPGCVNLDKSGGWCFEDGLKCYPDSSVDGITISHALMYVLPNDWPFVFSEFSRVLKPGGVLRITEDDSLNPASARYGGWKGSESARVLMNADTVRAAMIAAGFSVRDVTRDVTFYRDNSLRQAQHGESPDVFFIEGIRESALLFSPHSDDEALFASFTIIRHKPRVVICFPSSGDYGDTAFRTAESREAVAILGGGPVEQWDGTDLEAKMRKIDAQMHPMRVFAPYSNASHPDHVAVAKAAATVFGDRLTRYQTYIGEEKVRNGSLVPFEPGWSTRKADALACYRTQLAHPRARKFFMADFAEYYE